MANTRRAPVTEDATWGGYHSPPHIRAYVHARDGHACRYCGASGEGVVLETDHILPARLGGDNVCSNLATACRPCNRSKGGHTVACWQAGRPCRSRPRLSSYQYPQCSTGGRP